jgi:segregation and condensation protein B
VTIENEGEQQGEGSPVDEETGPNTERPESEGEPTLDGTVTLEGTLEEATLEGGVLEVPPAGVEAIDPEMTVNLTGLDIDQTVNLTGGPAMPAREDVPVEEAGRDEGDEPARDDAAVAIDVARTHLKGLLEALIFASDKPIKAGELAKTAQAATKQVKELLEELRADYSSHGIQLDEVAGGWIFRTNAAFAPFVRDLTKQKPVKLTRAQIETLSILAYRQPITRPEIDDIRGVDSGPVLKLLLDRDLVKILGKKDEPGRPLLYGTTGEFLEFFGLKSLKDLPTLREFTELTDESKRVVERELGESLEGTVGVAADDGSASGPPMHSDTLPPAEMTDDAAVGSVTEVPPAMPEDATEQGSKEDVEAAAGGAPPEYAAGVESGEHEAPSSGVDAPESGERGEGDEPPEINADDEDEFPDDDDSDFDDDDEDDEDEDDEEEEADE